MTLTYKAFWEGELISLTISYTDLLGISQGGILKFDIYPYANELQMHAFEYCNDSHRGFGTYLNDMKQLVGNIKKKNNVIFSLPACRHEIEDFIHIARELDFPLEGCHAEDDVFCDTSYMTLRFVQKDREDSMWDVFELQMRTKHSALKQFFNRGRMYEVIMTKCEWNALITEMETCLKESKAS